ncbi:unknown [Ambystoma tigrinum stebbensi virus]|uniref:Uncharacterized protein n=2 Tax=Ranavirus ambystoma1 TaxID=265294 RepID=A0A0U2JP28_9VIRU|nr:hypothetical protein ATVp64 [Ambystoma tigrinum virus]AAP33241.1 unknown [Ambystoma tigrinum stebbensi virus]ALN36555.1 hypothetical protein 60R [Ambystoma tigrinum virus]ALN37666.1 hypothetical protein 69R [Ambystoma tigrinum virus]
MASLRCVADQPQRILSESIGEIESPNGTSQSPNGTSQSPNGTSQSPGKSGSGKRDPRTSGCLRGTSPKSTAGSPLGPLCLCPPESLSSP